MPELLYRGFTPDIEIRAASKGGDGRTVEGIAVPYGRPQRIYDGLVEQFARGAFNHQLQAAHRVKFTREHGMLGGTLIGRGEEMRDDASGLWVALRVSATPTGDETLELIRDGALDELSIGFRESRNRTLPDGTIERTRANLFEVASVLRGAYGQAARIKALRAEGSDDGEPVVNETAAVEHERRERLARARQILAGLPPLPV